MAFSAQIQSGTKFGTASGKIELYSSILAQGTTFLQGTMYGGFVSPMPVYQNSLRGFYDPVASKYPLEVVSSHTRYRLNWQHDANPMMRNETYRHSVWLSTADANSRGIKDGRYRARHKRCRATKLTAYVTSRMVPDLR